MNLFENCIKAIKNKINVIALIACTLILIAPILSIYFEYPRCYLNSDLVAQVQAASNLLTMEKMVYTRFMPHDLSQPIYEYLSVSAPGYSFFTYLFLRSGLSMSVSLKIIELFFWFTGICGWAWLGAKYINVGLLKWLYLWIVVTMSQNYFYASQPSLELWAFMPYWIVFILKLKDDINDNMAFTYCLLLGLIASMSIIFRFPAVALIPSGIICIIFISGWDKWYSYLKGFTYSVFPVLTYGLICLKNMTEKEYATPLKMSGFEPMWQWLWFIFPLKNVSIDMFQLDRVMTRLLGFDLKMINMGDASIHIYPISIVSVVFTCVVILASVFVFVKLYKKRSFSRLIVAIFLVSFLSVTVGLMITGFYMDRVFQPFFRERFFLYLQPFYLLIIFIYLNGNLEKYFKSNITRVLTLAIVFGILMWGSLSYAKITATTRSYLSLKPRIDLEVSQISGGRPDAVVRIISPDLPGMFVGFNEQLGVYNVDYNDIKWDDYYCSKPTWLFIISDTEGLRSFEQTASKLGMRSRILKNVTIYYKLFPIGKIKI